MIDHARELEIVVAPISTSVGCYTCGATDKELDNSWGPFCADNPACKKIADGEADEAADSRYL